MYKVSPNNIPVYWIWLYWLNIFAWGFRGLIVNEYDSGKYDQITDITYLGKNLTIGQVVIRNIGFVDGSDEPYSFDWAWYSILFSTVVCIASVIGASIALVKVRFATGKSLLSGTSEEMNDKEKVSIVETALPFQRANLTFRCIHYTVVSSIGKEKIELLKGIDGVLKAGEMTALVSFTF